MKIHRTALAPDDLYKLLLLIAVLFGGIVRFTPVVMAGFPVNDGGMFYVMVEELKVNHFAIPISTQYNLADIPYAYPPFGFFVTALISALLKIPTLDLIRWLPPLVSTLSLLAFYLMADEILESRTQAALATLFYGLTPTAFEWVIMGGGITRSFGFLFLFLTIAFANRLFTRTSSLPVYLWVHAALTALFGALAFLSHPEAGIQAASISVLLWLFRGRTRMTFVYSLVVAFSVVLLTLPWWGTILFNHGLSPFQSALQTGSNGSMVYYLLQLLLLQFGGGIFFNMIISIGVIGLLGMLAQNEYLLPVWLILPSIMAPRSAHWMVLIPLALFAAFGFDKILAPMLLSLQKEDGSWLENRFVVVSLFLLALYIFSSAGLFGLELAGASLSAEDRQTITWVDKNIPPRSNFLLLTGEQYSMQDPFQEWFPALTKQHSLTTLQGLEWTLQKNFFQRHENLVALQHCADVSCVDVWRERTDLEYQYLLIKKLPEGSSSPLRGSLMLLLDSVRDSGRYRLIYEAGNTVIFQH